MDSLQAKVALLGSLLTAETDAANGLQVKGDALAEANHALRNLVNRKYCGAQGCVIDCEIAVEALAAWRGR